MAAIVAKAVSIRVVDGITGDVGIGIALGNAVDGGVELVGFVGVVDEVEAGDEVVVVDGVVARRGRDDYSHAGSGAGPDGVVCYDVAARL